MNIYAGLMRQCKAMGVLLSLLEEEFEALANNAGQEIASVEFSIQELIRQLMDEKEALRSILRDSSYSGLADYVHVLGPQDRAAMSTILDELKAMEERCSFQAMKNRTMASALAEQNAALVKFLYDQVAPVKESVYSSKGRWNDNGSRSTGIIRGML